MGGSAVAGVTPGVGTAQAVIRVPARHKPIREQSVLLVSVIYFLLIAKHLLNE
jgi:hypothetical protein